MSIWATVEADSILEEVVEADSTPEVAEVDSILEEVVEADSILEEVVADAFPERSGVGYIQYQHTLAPRCEEIYRDSSRGVHARH